MRRSGCCSGWRATTTGSGHDPDRPGAARPVHRGPGAERGGGDRRHTAGAAAAAGPRHRARAGRRRQPRRHRRARGALGGRGDARARARGDALLFLHADTRLPPCADACVLQALAGGACWGRFDVRIEGRPWMLRVVAASMNLRSRLTGIATGDQAIFVTRTAFERVGGFPLQPLMEDVEISKRLKRQGRPACLRQRVLTSGRRWEQRGVWRTIVLMWRLRWRYWRGESAARLAEAYR
ncbi:TIGR04283 family arsenosugar biosynthesis glycosyltransferase [Piscinibacter sakaiensis]|uniref:TIGR04283 family arsenosugar biosynthesis glycosyltransferase n=1 Tax=Piscinibacter sakaiensis TaxID=1547922 RepID=UPI003729C34A